MEPPESFESLDKDKFKLESVVKVECVDSDTVEGMIKIHVMSHPDTSHPCVHIDSVLLYKDHPDLDADPLVVAGEHTLVEMVMTCYESGVDVSAETFREGLTGALEQLPFLRSKLATMGVIPPEDVVG